MKQRIRRRGPDGHDVIEDIDWGPTVVEKIKHRLGGFRVSDAPKLKTGIDLSERHTR